MISEVQRKKRSLSVISEVQSRGRGGKKGNCKGEENEEGIIGREGQK